MSAGNPECYARVLAECKGPVNREHYVTAKVLEHLAGGSRDIGVVGLPFLGGVEKQLGIASLVGKVLCEHHNSLLSPFDSAGLNFAQAMGEMNNAAGNAAASEETLVVVGDLVERWMLKTLCGGLFTGNFRVPPPGNSLKAQLPPREWIEVLWKGRELPATCGLYLFLGPAGTMFEGNRLGLQFLPLFDQDNYVAGLRMWLFGFQFILSMVANATGPDFDESLYRPTGVAIIGSNKKLRLHWESGPRSGDAHFAWAGAVAPALSSTFQ
jgi:hypothetical protein